MLNTVLTTWNALVNKTGKIPALKELTFWRDVGTVSRYLKICEDSECCPHSPGTW